MRILLTGGTGFVGRALVPALQRAGHQLVLAVRGPGTCVAGCLSFRLQGLEVATDWRPALEGIEVVIHAAARAHVLPESGKTGAQEFRQVNVSATLDLARQALAAGVRRFIFVSSVKAMGDSTPAGKPFRADDELHPIDAYGQSKRDAEGELKRLLAGTPMELVIVRPVLVYGPGVAANFLGLMRWVVGGWPLPLASVRNCRSLVALDNLVDLIVLCVVHPAAGNQSFLVSDGDDVSTPELLRRVGRAMDKPVRLFGVPTGLLIAASGLFSRRAMAERLLGSLQVDIGKTRQVLGWTPRVPMDIALAATVRAFLENSQDGRE